MYKICPNIILEISKDGMNGYITLIDDELDFLNKTEDSSNSHLEKDIGPILEKVKDIIKVGLNEEELKRALLLEYYDEKMCIAEGISPVDGKDGYIKYYFDLEKNLTPKVLDDGTVDYKELDLINNVNKGDLLAELILPEEGKDGYKVTGESIPYKKGKKPNLRYGKNVSLLEDGVSLVASKDGFVELQGGKIVVSEVFEASNVDNNVGNIYFNGSVLVRGNALNGFQIKANGDVEIRGVVEGAYIKNNGNVLVKQGIQGYNKLTIKTSGNVTTKFVENAKIYSNRNIVAEAIMHSDIIAKGTIEVIGKKGLIVGGTCRAGKEIKAKTIGSTMATKTILEVGVDPNVKQKNEDFKNEIDIIKDNLDKIKKSLNLLDNLKKANRLDQAKAEMYIKLLKTKNILLKNLKTLENEYQINKEKMGNPFNGRVKVSDIVYPGVRIEIGDSTYFVRDEMKRCTFYRDKDDGDIKVGPY